MLAYEKFLLIEETNTDGRTYGTLLNQLVVMEEISLCRPDGSRTGLDWKVGEGELRVIF